MREKNNNVQAGKNVQRGYFFSAGFMRSFASNKYVGSIFVKFYHLEHIHNVYKLNIFVLNCGAYRDKLMLLAYGRILYICILIGNIIGVTFKLKFLISNRRENVNNVQKIPSLHKISWNMEKLSEKKTLSTQNCGVSQQELTFIGFFLGQSERDCIGKEQLIKIGERLKDEI